MSSSTQRNIRAIADFERHCYQIKETTTIRVNETPKEQIERKARALKDYNYFVKTYFPIYADSDCADFQIKAANAILKDPNAFAVLEWPREHAKSVHANVVIPMWLLAHEQLTGMLLMGKNEDDACNLLSDIQAQLQNNEIFTHDFGTQFKFGDWADGDFTTKDGIRFLACGREQSPRGVRKNEKRPNYGVIDDIDDDEIVLNPKRVKHVVKNILGAFYFALSIKGARVVMAGNRIHPNSILANIVGDVKPNMPKREDLIHSKVYATKDGTFTGEPSWPERYTKEELQRKIKKAGPTVAKVEFFHQSHVDGEIFKDDYIKWRKINLRKQIVIIGYFDPSFENKPTSDYKAIRVWGLEGDELNCIKSFVRRVDLITCFLFMYDFEDKLPPGVQVIWYMEQQFINEPVHRALFEAQKMKGRYLSVISDDRDKENKYTRIVRMEPMYSLNKVYYNEAEIHNADMIEGNNQLKGIEPGYKCPDDSPDADEGAWFYLLQHAPDTNFSPIIKQRLKKGW